MNLESTMKRKKILTKSYFLIFDFTKENINKNKILSKFIKTLHIFKFLNPI